MDSRIPPRLAAGSLACLLLIPQSRAFPGGLRDDAVAYRQEGYAQQQRGDLEGAVVSYQKAIALDPSYAIPHNDLGVLYEEQGQLPKAKQAYEDALALDPQYAEAHANLAFLAERLDQKWKAIYHWLKRYQVGDPHDPGTARAEARLVELGALRADSSLSLKERRLRMALKDPDWHVRYAAAWSLGQIDAATQPVLEALTNALDDAHYEVRGAAASTLEQLAWKPRTETERAAYVVAKQQWGQAVELGVAALPAVERALHDDDAGIRDAAAKALRDIRAIHPAAQQALGTPPKPTEALSEQRQDKRAGGSSNVIEQELSTQRNSLETFYVVTERPFRSSSWSPTDRGHGTDNDAPRGATSRPPVQEPLP